MYIPTRQEVMVYKPDIKNKWGEVIQSSVPFPLACRAEERVQLVNDRIGQEVVSNVEIIFKKLPNITYEDRVEYVNEIGDVVKRTPKLIAPARGLNGAAVYTSVYL